MTIEVTHIPETKIFNSFGRLYQATYPHGYPVNVRAVFHCEDCGAEVGGYFGNKVYRYSIDSRLCKACGEKDDPLVQMCIRQTGMTPVNYQSKYGVAWNE